MPEEVTIQEVMTAVTELRTEVEKKSVDHDKIVRIQAYLDQEEQRNQQLVAAQELAKQHAADIVELKAKLEKSGLTEAEAKGRIDALEAEIARAAVAATERDFHDTDEYKAINAWCKTGIAELETEQKALLRTDSAVDGGVLTTKEMDSEITKRIVEIDPIRSVARVRTISAKSLEMALRTSIPVATYEGEAEEGADSTSLYDAETVTPFRQTFTTPVTKDMLMDAAFDMEAEIASDAAEAFAFGEGNGFVLGTGHKMPAGFVANATLQAAARETTASGVVDAETLIMLSGDLKAGYNPVYVMNRRTLALYRTLKSTTGQFLWQPGLNGPVANTLNGFSYVLANSMPDVAAGAYAVAFGDFRRGYVIVDRTGMSVVRDEYTLKKKGIVEFTMNRWNTGRVVLTEAIKLLKIKT